MRLYQMPTIRSYAKCVSFYASARRWVSPESYGWQTQIGEPKKIDKAGKPYKSVRQVKHPDATDNVGYAWRYHDTDVVTWLTEDHIIVVPWASMSTTAFMEALLPDPFVANMHHPLGCLLGLRPGPQPEYPHDTPYSHPDHEVVYAAYSAKRSAWISGTGWFHVPEREAVHLHKAGDTWSIAPTEPIRVPAVNTRKAYAARRDLDTAGFSAWLDAILAMNPQGSVRDAQAYALARAGDRGAELAEKIHPHSDTGLVAIRQALSSPEFYWAILASPHLSPPARYSRGGRQMHRYPEELVRDWRDHLKNVTLLAAYRLHSAVEVTEHASLASQEAVTFAWRLAQRWKCDNFSWPVVSP